MISKFFSTISHDYSENLETRKKVKKRFLIISGLIVLIGIIWIGSIFWKNSRTMQSITVEGNSEVATAEVKLLADVKVGTRLMAISPSVIKSRLTKNPKIKTAIVKVELPKTLKIIVKERTPIARLNGEKTGMMDERGYGMPEMSKKFFDIPIISGTKNDYFGENWGLAKNKQLIQIANFLRKSKENYPVLYYLISEIKIIDERSFLVYTQDGAIPLIMDYDNALEQMVYFKEFWIQVVQVIGADKFKYVDLRANKVITTKEL
jgi:cell division septal protein FtsQ